MPRPPEATIQPDDFILAGTVRDAMTNSEVKRNPTIPTV
jgi:hypothetical protein